MTHLRVLAIVGKRGSRDRDEKLGRDRRARREGEDLGVHLVQVHVPGDGLRLEGSGVHGSAATSASPRRHRPRSPPGRCRRGRPRPRCARRRARAHGCPGSRTDADARGDQRAASTVAAITPKRGVGAADQPDPAGAGQHAHERGGQRDVAQVAREARLGHRRPRRPSARWRSRPSPARARPAVADERAQRDGDGEHAADVDRRREHRGRAAEDLHERVVGERGRVRVRLAGARRRRAGSRPSRGTRARTRGRRARAPPPSTSSDASPRVPVGDDQEEAVERDERPHLRPQQRGARGRAGTRRGGGRRGGARSPTGTARRGCPRSCRGRSCG